MFVFIDESGSTNIRSGQKFLVLAFCVCKNKQFAEELVREIRGRCQKQGKPILNPREIKYHDMSRFQQEIAIELINSKYRKYYVAYVDIERADARMTTGKSEDLIQRMMLEAIAREFRDKLESEEEVTVFIDEKLSKESMVETRHRVQELKKSKKAVKIECRKSQTVGGLQLADLIAGAFRAKLMKTSGLLKIEDERIFECQPSPDGITTKRKTKR